MWNSDGFGPSFFYWKMEKTRSIRKKIVFLFRPSRHFLRCNFITKVHFSILYVYLACISESINKRHDSTNYIRKLSMLPTSQWVCWKLTSDFNQLFNLPKLIFTRYKKVNWVRKLISFFPFEWQCWDKRRNWRQPIDTARKSILGTTCHGTNMFSESTRTILRRCRKNRNRKTDVIRKESDKEVDSVV